MTKTLLNLSLGARAKQARARLLDAIYAPVISRLTDDEYFGCRTRNDCVRALLRRCRAA